MTDKPYPRPAVSAVIVEQGRVLLIRRGHDPGAGWLTFPGGKVEWGETAEQALIREVLEETGLQVQPLKLLACSDLLQRDANGKLLQHFVILTWNCRRTGGTLRAGSDAAETIWLDAEQLCNASDMPDNVRTLGLQALGSKMHEEPAKTLL